MPEYNISVNELKLQGTVTRRMLATSTTLYSFTFNLARKCLERRYTSIFSSFISSKDAHRVLTCGFLGKNITYYEKINLHFYEQSAISLASITVNDVLIGLKINQR